MPICTLLTDFGGRDWYVGALKGTLLRLAPGTTLVDLAHDVAAGDVAAASLVLAGAAPTFPPGTLHLAVVDPGVGSDRRILACQRQGHTFVAPDNGLLTSFLDDAAVHAVERPDLYLDAPGETFHGRDRFAPVAAALLRGEPLRSFGPPIDDALGLRRRAPSPGAGDRRIVGQVTHVDHYGNLITDIPAALVRGSALVARVGSLVLRRLASHYAELQPGEPGLLVGSLGTLEVAFYGASAAEATGLGRGQQVTIEIDPQPAPPGDRRLGR